MDEIVNLLKSDEHSNNQEDLILRDRLALVRTKLANERTLFSYIRTSLYLLTVGIGILEIKTVEHLIIIAYVSICCSVLLFFMGLLKFYRLNKHLKSYAYKNAASRDNSRL